MTRGVFNWTFANVTNYLNDNHFSLNHVEGSHYFYVGTYQGEFRQVCVPFHGSRTIKPRTLNGIILQSGIPRKNWLAS